eukprot:8563399-Pyramimonas_sp.AAC.1
MRIRSAARTEAEAEAEAGTLQQAESASNEAYRQSIAALLNTNAAGVQRGTEASPGDVVVTQVSVELDADGFALVVGVT